MPRKPPSSARSGKKAPAKAESARSGVKPVGLRPPAGAVPRAPGKAEKGPQKAPPKALPKTVEPDRKLIGKAGVLAARAAAKAGAALAPGAAKAVPGAVPGAKVPKKAGPKAPKKPATPRAAPRLKIVWAVCDHALKTIKTFPYPERRAAELEASRLQKSKGKEHLVRPERVPMTAQPEARR